VTLSIISQSTAAFRDNWFHWGNRNCDWKEFNTSSTFVIIRECNSPTINSTFLGNASIKSPNIERLKIQTSLTVIEDERFVQAINLKTLVLGDNKIQRVYEHAFIGLPKLKILKLNTNQIQNLPMDVFADLPNLNELYLEENRLTSFDFSIVKHNLQLNVLRIYRNKITDVITSQQYSSNLTYIDMESNSLTSLPVENLPVCLNLQKLYIYRNNLTEFAFESVADKFPNLKYIYVSYNRFDCCYLVDMVEAMLFHMKNLTIDSDIIQNLNDTKTLQRQKICVKCVKPYQHQKIIGELKMIIGTLQAENQKLFNHVLAFEIGFGLILFVLITIGGLCFYRFRKPTKSQSNEFELQDDTYMNMDVDIPSKDEPESYYCN
jgi:Leucine rich repeat